MMIKGSLLRSIHIVKRFSASENGAKNWGFGRFRGGKLLTLTTTPPRKSISTETRYLAQKRCRWMQKMWSPEAGKKFYKKKYKI